MEIYVVVTPGARKERFRNIDTAVYEAHIRELPLNNAVNMRLREMVARYFDVKVRDVRINKGQHSRKKQLIIRDI